MKNVKKEISIRITNYTKKTQKKQVSQNLQIPVMILMIIGRGRHLMLNWIIINLANCIKVALAISQGNHLIMVCQNWKGQKRRKWLHPKKLKKEKME